MSYQIIENEVAYERATKAAILSNARKTFQRTYEDWEAIYDFLCAGRVYEDETGAVVGYRDGFVGSIAAALDKYGKLTPKQVEAVRKSIAKAAERRAEWKSQQAARDAKSEWVGEVGKRIEMTIKCVHVVELDGFYGVSYLNICEDEAGNKVIYKGTSSFLNKGETGKVKATIKEHGVRDGFKQTIIARPVVLGM